MQPEYLTAIEHQVIPVKAIGTRSEVTPLEAERLARIGEGRPGFCRRGYLSVRLAQYCGIVSIGGRILEILPKIDDDSPAQESRGLLLRLLHEATQLPLFTDLPVGQHLRRARLLEVFIAAFLETVANIARGGLLRLYQEQEADLRVVRGRISCGQQFGKNFNRPDTISCRFDDLTGDNVWNRLIKGGLRAVRPWIASTELDRRWIELMAVLDEVQDVQVDPNGFNRLVFDRHAMRYRSAIEWVRRILSLLSPELRAGKDISPGLLLDMNLLFQSAVASSLRRRVPQGVSVEAQGRGRWLSTVAGTGGRRKAFGLRPDLLLRETRGLVALGDTKWKRVGVTASGYLKPSAMDIYQMHSYAIAYGCERLALIYPWYSALAGSRETEFELPGSGELRPIVTVVCVDVRDPRLRPIRGAQSEFGRILGFAICPRP